MVPVGTLLSTTIAPVAQQLVPVGVVTFKPLPLWETAAGLDTLNDRTQPSPTAFVHPDCAPLATLKKIKSVPAVVCVALAVQLLTPLLQNSVTGDGHGCTVLLSPETTATGVPITLLLTGILYKLAPVVAPVPPTT